jgi:exodeoxyribonuclease VII large subunit
LASKIIQANNFKTPIDVLIVGRGGGSYEDL